jgi:copper resistance protein C
MIMRAILAITAATLLATTTGADAHAFLLKSSPAVGSTVERGTKELTLQFSEAVELVFSRVEITTASGTPVPLSPVRFADATHRQLATVLPMLASGNYHVKWHVVSADTHRTEGTFTFTIKP